MIVGIDPGKEGAIVALSLEGKIKQHWLLPKDEAGVIDYLQLKKIFEEIACKISGGRIYLERAMPMAMGAKHAFTYGREFSMIEIAILETKLPVVYVEPSKWPKVVCEGIDKDLKPKVRSIMAAKRLFPSEVGKIPVSPRSKVMHEGVVDALLIAEFGRRQGMLSS